jgi:hypothetical protein
MKPTHHLHPPLLIALLCAAAAPVRSFQEPPPGKALAWMSFDNAAESYQGTPYIFLGFEQINLKIDVPPVPGQALDLLWGAKNDTRAALVTINGSTQRVEHGGYDGFRWLRVPLPADIKGELCEVSLAQTDGKAAFIARVRLSEPSAAADRQPPDEPAGRISLTTTKVGSDSAAAVSAAAAAGERFFESLPADPLERSAILASLTISKVQRWLHEVALKKIEPDTGLYHPDGNFNYQDAWADCYPFLVWAAWLTDLEALNGPVRGALHAEIEHCPTGFFTDPANTFGGSEYVKDGLIAIVEVTGKDEWFDRMKAVEDEIWSRPTIDTPYGKIPSTNLEVNGEQIQVLVRLYTMTGEARYLDWAERLADSYLLPGGFVPERLRDHGCEIIGGLGLLFGVESVHRPAKAREYLPYMKEMLDTVLARGTNADGIMHDQIGPRGRLSDGWGYNYVAYLCYDMVAGAPVYRGQVERVLRNLAKPLYRNHPWEGSSIDGFADSVEGGLYLLNRFPVREGLRWADREVAVNIAYAGNPEKLWGTMKLQSNGVRTAIMHALMHTRGLIARPWRQDLTLGAQETDGGLTVLLRSEKPYQGRLVFDIPRHRLYLRFRHDWPRMNTLPEWFTVEPGQTYQVRMGTGPEQGWTGQQLHDGLPVDLPQEGEIRIRITP